MRTRSFGVGVLGIVLGCVAPPPTTAASVQWTKPDQHVTLVVTGTYQPLYNCEGRWTFTRDWLAYAILFKAYRQPEGILTGAMGPVSIEWEHAQQGRPENTPWISTFLAGLERTPPADYRIHAVLLYKPCLNRAWRVAEHANVVAPHPITVEHE